MQSAILMVPLIRTEAFRFSETSSIKEEQRVSVRNVFVVVQFYPWFKFYFPLFFTHYHISPYPKTKGSKI